MSVSEARYPETVPLARSHAAQPRPPKDIAAAMRRRLDRHRDELGSRPTLQGLLLACATVWEVDVDDLRAAVAGRGLRARVSLSR